MNDGLVRVEPMTAVEIRAQVNRIQEVMQAIMIKGVHYDTVPGCGDKPTLLKPGAEKLLSTFKLSADPLIEDLSGQGFVRYRIRATILNNEGVFVGAGMGECSSDEEKYRWRKAVCTEEFDETSEDRRRKKWKAGYGGKEPYFISQVRVFPPDIANTVLKMAVKRAVVAGALIVTAASDIFEQDIEDIPEGLLDRDEKAPSKTSTVKKAEGKKKEKPKDERTIQQKLGDALHSFCNGDEAFMKEVLKEISYFEPKDGKPKWLESVKKSTDKWAGTSLKKLKEKIKEEGEGKEEPPVKGGYPEGCTEKPIDCDHSVYKARVAFCGDVNTACAFWKDERF